MQPAERASLAGRLAPLAATTCTALLLCGALVQLCPAANAARGRRGTLSSSARVLARIVRHSAHRAGHGRPGGVVTIRCCGQRTLAVYYRARPRAGLPWHGTYELKLRRRGAFLGIGGGRVLPDRGALELGGAAASEGPRYEFTISSPRRARGWRLSVSDSYLACPPPSMAAAQCDGFSDALSLGEPQLGRRHMRALLRQALKVVPQGPPARADLERRRDGRPRRREERERGLRSRPAARRGALEHPRRRPRPRPRRLASRRAVLASLPFTTWPRPRRARRRRADQRRSSTTTGISREVRCW